MKKQIYYYDPYKKMSISFLSKLPINLLKKAQKLDEDYKHEMIRYYKKITFDPTSVLNKDELNNLYNPIYKVDSNELNININELDNILQSFF